MLAHASKLGRVAVASVCPLERIDVLVTDDGASLEALSTITDSEVEVLTA